MNGDDTRVPVTVVTGFLGAGKTTLINRLLRHPDMARAAVVVNEFGAIGIDHLLVKKVDESIVLLASGCICCTLLGDFRNALRELFMRSMRRSIPPLSHIVLETSGFADPAPIRSSLAADPFLAQRYRMQGVVAVTAAIGISAQCEQHPEASRQVAAADLVVMSKCDLATADQIEVASALIAELAPGASRIHSMHGDVATEIVLAPGTPGTRAGPSELARWLPLANSIVTNPKGRFGAAPPVRHSSDVWRGALTMTQPLPWSKVTTAVDELLARHGGSLLRIKGLVHSTNHDGPVLLDCVGRSRYPIVELDAWPATGVFADRSSTLVVIAQSIAPSSVAEALRSLAGRWSAPS